MMVWIILMSFSCSQNLVRKCVAGYAVKLWEKVLGSSLPSQHGLFHSYCTARIFDTVFYLLLRYSEHAPLYYETQTHNIRQHDQHRTHSQWSNPFESRVLASHLLAWVYHDYPPQTLET